jgi:hypothetical protein
VIHQPCNSDTNANADTISHKVVELGVSVHIGLHNLDKATVPQCRDGYDHGVSFVAIRKWENQNRKGYEMMPFV